MKLYKYRGVATLARDLETLRDNYIYAPTFETLNDPTEALFQDSQIRQIAKLLGQQMASSIETVLEFRNKLGIFSLSKRPDDELLWAHYAENHCGYCIEYDLERIRVEPRNQWEYLEINYASTPPIIELNDLLQDSGQPAPFISKLLGTKSERWRYEKEYRILTTVSGKNFHASQAITGIYFGVRSTIATKREIRKTLANRELGFYEMHFPKLSYMLQSNALAHDENLDGTPLEYLAFIDESALPEQENKRRIVAPFVDIVRRDPDCIKVVQADISVNSPNMVYVQFETRVKTPLSSTVNRYFTL